MPPVAQVSAPSVLVAQSGAPSQPMPGFDPLGHVVPGGLAMYLPHASWCMSITE